MSAFKQLKCPKHRINCTRKGIFGESDTELRRFWYSALYLILSFTCTGMFNVIAQKRGQVMIGEGPLPDLGFDTLYEFTHELYGYNPYICDDLTIIQVCLCVLWVLLFLGRRDKGYERRIVVFKRWIIIIAITFNIRSICVISTVLPRPWEDEKQWNYCKSEDNTFTWNVFLEMIYYVLGKKSICYDFFFSGHTSNVIAVCLIVQKYSHCKYWKIFNWMMAITMILTLIAVRSHYTIDVWGGILVTTFLFKIFDLEVKHNDGIFAQLEKQENDINSPAIGSSNFRGDFSDDSDFKDYKNKQNGLTPPYHIAGETILNDIKFSKVKKHKSLSVLSNMLSPSEKPLKIQLVDDMDDDGL